MFCFCALIGCCWRASQLVSMKSSLMQTGGSQFDPVTELMIKWTFSSAPSYKPETHVHPTLVTAAFSVLRIRFGGRSNTRWRPCPGSAFPRWPCFSLKFEDTANCTTASMNFHWVRRRASSDLLVFMFLVVTRRVSSGWPGLVISMISFLFFTDMCIYWIHRFLHHKLIYKVSATHLSRHYADLAV